jgi:uncharacterized protein
MMIQRPSTEAEIRRALSRSPICALLGPRQCGKTTLALSLRRSFKAAHFFDLEDPSDLARLTNPKSALTPLRGLVILDEIQRQPELLPVLRVLADRKPLPARFLILGSAAPELIRGASESLAGRIEFVEMSGFLIDEVRKQGVNRLWVRGGFPDSFLARSEASSLAWRESFIRTFIERDVPQMGVTIASPALRRFWTMMAHYHGAIWNGSEIGGAMGMAHTTVTRYLDLLSQAYVMRRLLPWSENTGKRVVKSPKVYIRDSGILHALLGLPDEHALSAHPKVGASWEGFAIEQIVAWAGERNCYFWATQGGAELDLLVLASGRRFGFEIKRTERPSVTKSMRVAISDLNLERLFVVYPGNDRFPLETDIECLGVQHLDQARALVRRKANARARP